MTRHVSVGVDGRTKWEHRLVAERALGRPLPQKAVVHHVNRNGKDNRSNNLVICEDQAYHLLLHRRMRVREAGGNPDTDLWCSSCRVPRPIELFTKRRTGKDAGCYVSSCRDCNRAKRAQESKRRWFCLPCERLFKKSGDCPLCGFQLERWPE